MGELSLGGYEVVTTMTKNINGLEVNLEAVSEMSFDALPSVPAALWDAIEEAGLIVRLQDTPPRKPER